MAVYKLFPQKDAFINSENPTLNTGKDEILEIANYKDNSNNTQISRALIQFSTEKIQHVLQVVAEGVPFESFLKLFLANASQAPTEFKLTSAPITKPWENGVGKFSDSPIDSTGVSWNFTRGGLQDAWDSAGGDFNTGSLVSQSFNLYDKLDAQFNVTSTIQSIVSGSVDNYGFIVNLPGTETVSVVGPYVEFEEDFSVGTGSWDFSTGSMEISSTADGGLNGSSYYLRHTPSQSSDKGVLSISSSLAYGVWEFDWYQSSVGSNSLRIYHISGTSNPLGSGAAANTYHMFWNVGGSSFAHQRNSGDAISDLENFRSSGFTSTGNWYRVKVLREEGGVTSVYAKGGSFGSEFVLLTATSGTNPFTDNTIANSEFFSIVLNGDSAITNIIAYDPSTITTTDVERDLNLNTTLKYFSKDTNSIFSPQLSIKWDDSVYNTGSLDLLDDTAPTITLSNNKFTYFTNEIVRFRLSPRPTFPTRRFTTSSIYKEIYALPIDSTWALKDESSEELIIDFDSQYTKINCDSKGPYIDIYMEGLEPERYYRLLFKTPQDGSIKVIDNTNLFKLKRYV